MKGTMTLCAAALGALACAGSLQAHHTGSMYDRSPIWIEGTVIRFESIDPHTIAVLEATNEDGQVRRWAVEGPSQSQLDLMGIGTDVPKVGDVIEFCAFPYKSAAALSRLFPAADFPARRAPPDTEATFAGHVMVMADEEMRLWEPHGLLSECIRTSDHQRQSWLDLLNSNGRARQSWCFQRGFTHVQSSASLRELVEEINGLMADPCG